MSHTNFTHKLIPFSPAAETPSETPVRFMKCYDLAIARLREKADTNESTIRCSAGLKSERKDQLCQEINICRSAAQWLEEDSAERERSAMSDELYPGKVVGECAESECCGESGMMGR